MDTFNPSISPSPGGTSNPEIKLHRSEFGDGYTQTSPVGIQHIKQMIELRWNGVTLEQRFELVGFFEDHGGYKPFLYQPYGFATPLKWTCSKWSGTTNAPLTFQASLVQDFSGPL